MLKKDYSTYVYLFLFLSIIFLVVIVSFLFIKRKEVVYVNSEKIFNEFLMTRELKSAGEKGLNAKNNRLDSLYAYLGVVKDENIKSKVIKEIINQKQQIEFFQQEFVKTNSDNIWKRINSYVKDYAIQKKYDLIVGPQTQGTVFYGNGEMDVTNELLIYVNKRYEGHN